MRKTNINKYLEKVKAIHGSKYDYSKIFFNNWRDKIDVICSIHGQFKIRPDQFYNSGCQKCAIANFKKLMTLSTDEFIKRSTNVHGNIYDYSKANCKGTKKKIKIICPAHGLFEQVVDSHINGSICPRCNKEISGNRLRKIVALKTFSLDETIKKSKDKHNNKYTYDLSIDYKNTDSILKIKCKLHGWFYQMATKHLGGQGCIKCGYITISKKTSKTLDKFIKEANRKHNNFYDYSKTIYFSAHKKILINCPNHGLFEQDANSHLKGAGCLKCSIIKLKERLSSTTSEFNNKAKLVHENLYDYSKVEYKNSLTKIIIICVVHGEFKQKPFVHLNGSGCPICSSSKGEKKVIKYLKNNKIDYIHQWMDHDCRPNKRLVVFDFMLPALNVIIEYDGEQHFKIKFKPKKDMKIAQEKLKKTQYNDFYKDTWAKLNNYKMIRIKYTEDVSKVLDKFFV